jgi:hypothetical protein
MADLGKMLLLAGAILLVIGALLTWAGKIPWLGRLPGDIYVERENFRFYFPFATSIVLSVFLTLLLWILRR